MEIKITRAAALKEKPDSSTLVFGKAMTDHMFIVDYDAGQGWHDPRIVPYGPLQIDPAAKVLHYGEEIFEGLKAYRTQDGSIQLFRPRDNIARMNQSAQRLCLPQIPEELALAGITELVKVEQDWENGRLAYEVEFWNGSTEYDYTIDGATGSVLEYKKEVRAAAPNATGTAYIGETAAGEVALAHAGLTQAAASDYRCWMDYDDGYPHCYRVEFTTGPSLYQYQIGLYDGAVLHHGCSSYGGHHQSSRHGGCHY